jgi:hypothetical protein
MIIRRGDYEDLSGNVVVYWDINGVNYLSPGDEILAANFTVSAIPYNNKILTATFPPVSFKDLEKLMRVLTNVKCEIIYGGTISFPKDEKDFHKYYKQEFAKYNKIIEQYTVKYKDKFKLNYLNLSEKEHIHILAESTQKVRTQISKNQLSNKTRRELIDLTDFIQSSYTKYDIKPFLKIVFKSGKNIDKLSNLYIKKFLAIFYEEYEQASTLHEKITNYELQLKI